jgi:hypothetical protein
MSNVDFNVNAHSKADGVAETTALITYLRI